MVQLTADDGPVTILSALRVLAARLRSRPDTAPRATPVTAAADDLDAAAREHDTATWDRLAASGGIVFADEVEDEQIAEIARHVRVLVKGDRTSDLYVQLFAEAPSTTTKGVATEEQARLARLLLDRLSTPAYAPLASLVPALRAARAGVEAAQDHHAKCEERELRAWNVLQARERTARDAFNGVEPRLRILVPGEKRKVESFFPTTGRKKKAAAAGTPTE